MPPEKTQTQTEEIPAPDPVDVNLTLEEADYAELADIDEPSGEEEEPAPIAAVEEDLPAEEEALASDEEAPVEESVEEDPPKKVAEAPEDAAPTEEAAAPPVEAEPAKPAAVDEPKQPTEAEIASSMQAYREELLPQLEKTYSFTEEDQEAYTEDPAKFLSKMAAELHLGIYTSLWNSLHAVMPRVMDNYSTTRQARDKEEEAFYTEWPALREHPADAMNAVKAFRQVNPNASKKEIIQKAGLMAMVNLGLEPTKAPVKETKTPVSPPPRKAVGANNSGPPRKTKPVEDNPFVEIVNEFQEEGGY